MATQQNQSYKKSSIYTRTGDDGTSSLYNGERVSKTKRIIKVLGGVDEINSALGMCKFIKVISAGVVKAHWKDQVEPWQLQNKGATEIIEQIQHELMKLSSDIATPIRSSSPEKREKVNFPLNLVENLEKMIDEMDAKLPKLTTFILPGGSITTASIHQVRAICRRTELGLVKLAAQEPVNEAISMYINRLSDFLFVFARSSAYYFKDCEIKH